MNANPQQPDRKAKAATPRATPRRTAAGSGRPSAARNPAGRGGGGRGTHHQGGEFRSGPVHGTALVNGITFRNKGVLYADVGGMAIFEGDIVLGSVEQVKRRASATTTAAGDTGMFAS